MKLGLRDTNSNETRLSSLATCDMSRHMNVSSNGER